MTGIKWEDRYVHYGSLPDHTLFDLARNEAAPLDYRKMAVEILILNGSDKAKHPELRGLRAEILIERAENPEPEPVFHESELSPTEDFGALKASVTTATMFQDPEPVHFPDEDLTPADEAPISSDTTNLKDQPSES